MTAAPAGRGSRRAQWFRWGLPALAVVLIGVVVLVVVGIGGEDDPGSSAATSTSAPTLPSDFPESAEAESTSTEPPAVATQAPAPSVVARQGVAESERTVEGATAPFTEPAEWADGAAVRVVDARQQVSSGSGPGALAGQPQTVFELEITNGSDTPLDLGAVVVSATYGADRIQASPLYEGDVRDFAGTLEPGGTATAVYSFAVPEDQLGDVVLTVDVDGYRFPAVFSGAVPVG